MLRWTCDTAEIMVPNDQTSGFAAHSSLKSLGISHATKQSHRTVSFVDFLITHIIASSIIEHRYDIATYVHITMNINIIIFIVIYCIIIIISSSSILVTIICHFNSIVCQAFPRFHLCCPPSASFPDYAVPVLTRSEPGTNHILWMGQRNPAPWKSGNPII